MVERRRHLSSGGGTVAQGHDVTLIAPGDSKTSAKTGFILPKNLYSNLGYHGRCISKLFYHLQKTVGTISKSTDSTIVTHIYLQAQICIFSLSQLILETPHVTTLHRRLPL